MTLADEVLKPVAIAAQAAADKKGRSIVAFDVSEQLSITDVFLIASANNERNVGAIVDGVEEALLKAGFKPVRREGDRENRWVLLDYLDFVVHVQHSEERTLYNLERLWKDCPQIPLEIDLPEDDDEEL
ncbi:MAG TPA: ribosome silencing factor [Tessaracoccus flavescens]|uniref:Ribosomal silencing factor RsfS n=1 Tax=Tessaracoccus flavescens TaxID=399497 RepID=A0A921JQB3_9ACTN|nr:ribosome silencing factor [Tessaracoccus flavescens]